MGLRDAKRLLQWNEVMEALFAAGVDADTVKMVRAAQSSGDMFQGLAGMLIGGADVSAAKNYVKFEMVGVTAPFDRVYVELVRPAGKTSHGLRELLRQRLQHVRTCLVGSNLIENRDFRAGLIQGIDEDLTAETP